MHWNEGSTRPVALAELGEWYRRYRLGDPEAEEAMAGSLRRWGQLSPVVACERAGRLEVIDGFKRLSAARQIRELPSLSVRVLEADEPPGAEPRSASGAGIGGSVGGTGAGA